MKPCPDTKRWWARVHNVARSTEKCRNSKGRTLWGALGRAQGPAPMSSVFKPKSRENLRLPRRNDESGSYLHKTVRLSSRSAMIRCFNFPVRTGGCFCTSVVLNRETAKLKPGSSSQNFTQLTTGRIEVYSLNRPQPLDNYRRLWITDRNKIALIIGFILGVRRRPNTLFGFAACF